MLYVLCDHIENCSCDYAPVFRPPCILPLQWWRGPGGHCLTAPNHSLCVYVYCIILKFCKALVPCRPSSPHSSYFLHYILEEEERKAWWHGKVPPPHFMVVVSTTALLIKDHLHLPAMCMWYSPGSELPASLVAITTTW